MTPKWQEKSVGEVLQLEYGKPLGDSLRKVDGKFPVYGANGEKARTDKFYYERPTIIVGRKGSAGEINLTEEKFWPLDVTYFVTFDDKEYDLRFLYYLFLTLNLPDLAKGVKPGINRNDVYALQIKVPLLSEQRRVVGILDKAFSGIAIAKDGAERNLNNTQAIFESHLHEVFMQRNASHIWRRLEEVCERITVGHVGSMVTQYRDSGIPFLRSQNIRPFHVSLENIVYIDNAFHQSLAKSQLRPGDVAVVRTGYPGTAAVIPDSLPMSNCSDLVIVRPGPLADPHYLALFFNSRLGKELVAGRLVGAAQKHFNVTAAKHVEISFPTVLEQRRLVEKIKDFSEETRRLESLYQRKLTALDELKKSLLHQAFSGNL
jgi:type I restriction enzyme S subunit